MALSILKNIVVLSFLLGQAYPLSVSRFKSNLVLYSEYNVEERKIIYSNSDMSLWKDFTSLGEQMGFEEKAMLCGMGAGAWVAYPEPDFKIDNVFHSSYLIIGEACMPADNINSAQAVGRINKHFDGLVAFTEINFASEQTLISNDTSDSGSGVKSLIVPDDVDGEWTVEGDGKKYCLVRPDTVVGGGYCILPDMPTQLGIQAASVKIGCDDSMRNLTVENPVFLLDTCFSSMGVYRTMDNYMSVPVMSSICSGSGDEEQKLGFYKIYDTWKYRMNIERQQEANPVDIDKDRKDESSPAMMKLLNFFFQIFKLSCNLVEDEYFEIVRYLFLSHLKSAWDKAPHLISNETAVDWRKGAIYMATCLRARAQIPNQMNNNYDCKGVARHPNDSPKPDEENLAVDLFLQGDSFDTIIEHVWLMLNLVAPFCSSQTQYLDNYWVEFVLLFRRKILLPLLPQWVNPGPWLTYYQYMFNGYNLDEGKRRVIACVRHVISNTPAFDPIDRPSAAAKEFLSRYKLRQKDGPDKPAASPQKPAAQAKPDKTQATPKKKGKRQTRSTAGDSPHKKGDTERPMTARQHLKTRNHPKEIEKAGPRASRA